jgi:hypothetical protein
MSFNRKMARRILASMEDKRRERLPNAPRCPHCNELIDAASCAGEMGPNDGPAHKLVPGEGDVTVCAYCAGVGRYAADGKITKLDVKTLDVDAQRVVRDAQNIITESRAFHGRGMG